MFRVIRQSRRFSTEVPKNKKIITINTDVLKSFSENKICQPIFSLLSYNDGLIARTEFKKMMDEPNFKYPFYYMPNETHKQEIIKFMGRYETWEKGMCEAVCRGSVHFGAYAGIAGFLFGMLYSEQRYPEGVFMNGVGGALFGGVGTGVAYFMYSYYGPVVVFGVGFVIVGTKIMTKYVSNRNGGY